MKTKYLLLLFVVAALLLTATQALASPATTFDYRHTPSPMGPGRGNDNPGGDRGNHGNSGQDQNGDHGKGNKNGFDEKSLAPGKPFRVHRVGTVVAYTAGQSITIQDRFGNQSTFLLTSDTKYLPKSRVGSLGVGSYVTIIAPRDPHSGNTMLTATGVVIHPHAPTSFPTATFTPTFTATPTSTETPTSTPTETPTVTGP
jgi:hypothetical protein